ncbi:MAG: hypothetical protein DCC49_12935 [Acidobacteria bacterium]|nr:MAG: hypothetical protein DCC49_12935 [Acidobacteriota bacterium]
MGEMVIEPVAAIDWDRIDELMGQHADMDLGIVDASVVAAAERVGVARIATLDRKDASAIRPRHVESFHLLP